MAIQSGTQLLLSKITMYLTSGAGDKQGRQLLEEAVRHLRCSWNNDRMERLCDRMEMVCNSFSAHVDHYQDLE